jgi:hypothetical protein
MTKVVRSRDCGNSPKNTLLEDLTIALAKRDTRFLIGVVTEDVRWNVVGRRVVEGRRALVEAIDETGRRDTVTKIAIDHVVSHGRAGAVDGTMQVAKRTVAYCNIYEFDSAKGTSVRTITTYAIEQQ